MINFPAIGLRKNANAMHYFISAKLLPSSNISGVTKEWAALNYAILKGLIVDVGKDIQSSILYIARGSNVAGLGHPSLIYELYCLANIPTCPGEVIMHPKGALIGTIISHYHILSREELEHLQQDAVEPPQAPGPSTPPPPMTSSSFVDLTRQITEMRE
ncbi:hypothetical protein PanWU01x14_022300 [Parasponia andersonii]|uniref:Putative plant transposon protein domain-containing protein n=1 Tax=Parasponia andersonii TaxID=3476 RepID=A0A2P5DX64_PARAD|nr:hypothetical protein PanWU01x14_022300 [Parasponia andersonii]